MKDNSHYTLILALADIIIGKQIDTKKVTKSLELICNSFSFECALVYEVDQYNHFNLIENYSLSDIKLCNSFNAYEIESDFQKQLAHQKIIYLDKNKNYKPCEIDFMNIFHAESLIGISVIDENFNNYGFILFLNTTSRKIDFSDSELNTLCIVLSLLEKYLSVRIHRNKVFFTQTALESIINNTGIDIYVIDFYTYDIIYVNKSMAEPYGGISQFLGQKCWQVLFPGQTSHCEFCPQENLIDENGNITGVHTWNYQRPFDGAWFRVFSTAFRWIDGRLAHLVSSADITDNKKNEELIEYMANYDVLTGLPNRRMLIEECKNRIDNAKEDEQGYVIFFDIDGFKVINDNYGHDAGDEFLIKLGEFFSSIPLLKNSVYRNGGDEFVAVIGGDITKNNIRNLVSFIHERFKNPWNLKNGSIYCNTSVGIACYPEDGNNAEELINKADQAMYQIKKTGGSGICFGYQLIKND
ncbi:sensor domain-containing diguanylate cyclase [Clostridioides sp. ES-S-0145-01]|uniref:sensor domain-containing diguanylate cyclase n=1 Tax=Clostridioides sp. ES-S-0145-01 TaxID=2770784 RepID=UPI001D12F078|nr:sensor domain-containing diguanylate cyclase [Clostridioides sp. ES-S-0145-01]